MKRKLPTKKEMVEKIEAINSVNNLVARHLDNLGYAFTQYLTMKGDAAEFKKYLEKIGKVRNLKTEPVKKDNNGAK